MTSNQSSNTKIYTRFVVLSDAYTAVRARWEKYVHSLVWGLVCIFCSQRGSDDRTERDTKSTHAHSYAALYGQCALSAPPMIKPMAFRPERPYHVDLVKFGTLHRFRRNAGKSRTLVQHGMHLPCRGRPDGRFATVVGGSGAFLTQPSKLRK